MSTQAFIPPTQEEIENALDVVSRYSSVMQSSGETSSALTAFQQQKEKNKELVAESDQLQVAIYRRLLDALPPELIELMALYSMMVIAPYAVNKDTFQAFQLAIQKAKELLAELEKK